MIYYDNHLTRFYIVKKNVNRAATQVKIEEIGYKGRK